MVLKFICRCGKHLKAREHLAERRVRCPACGAPVGVPSLAPDRDNQAGPLSRDEIRARDRASAVRSREVSESGSAAIQTEPAASSAMEQVSDIQSAPGTPPAPDVRVRSRSLRFPRRFADSVISLLPAQVSVLTLALTGLSSWVAFVWTKHGLGTEDPWNLVFLLIIFLLAFPALGWAAALCQFTFLWACGDVRRAILPSFDLRRALRGGSVGMVCFLAGPVVPALYALWYWFWSGDLVILDWVILGELALLGVGYWLLAFVAVTRSDRLWDANPWQVARLVHRLGLRTVLAVLAATFLVVVLGGTGLLSVQFHHNNVLQGWVMLGFLWVGELVAWMWVFALLGYWCRRLNETQAREES